MLVVTKGDFLKVWQQISDKVIDGRCQGEGPKGWEGQQLFKEDDDALR
jgi:hypothetical protein